MNIHLISYNTTFGTTYISPSDEFVSYNSRSPEDAVRPYKFDHHSGLVSFQCSKNKAYFVNVEYEHPVRGPNGVPRKIISRSMAIDYSRLITECMPSLSCLNPDTRFISIKTFSDCEVIPFTELKNRNIAVIADEGTYHTLGEIGKECRRASFYHNKANIHRIGEDQIDELVDFGYFTTPWYLTKENMPSDDKRSLVCNILPLSKRYGSDSCYDVTYIADLIKKYKVSKPFLWGNTHRLQAHPVIKIDDLPQPAVISSVFSPYTGEFSKLIRHPDTRLTYLSEPDAIREKNFAFLKHYENFPKSILRKEYSAHIITALFQPYDDAIELSHKISNKVTELLIQARSDFQSKPLASEEAKNSENTINEFLKCLEILCFTRHYIRDTSKLIKEIILLEAKIEAEMKDKESTRMDLKAKPPTPPNKTDQASSSTNYGNALNARKRLASDSSGASGADVIPQKRAKNDFSTVNEIRADQINKITEQLEIIEHKYIAIAFKKNLTKAESYPLLHIHSFIFTAISSELIFSGLIPEDSKNIISSMQEDAAEIVCKIHKMQSKSQALQSLRKKNVTYSLTDFTSPYSKIRKLFRDKPLGSFNSMC